MFYYHCQVPQLQDDQLWPEWGSQCRGVRGQQQDDEVRADPDQHLHVECGAVHLLPQHDQVWLCQHHHQTSWTSSAWTSGQHRNNNNNSSCSYDIILVFHYTTVLTCHVAVDNKSMDFLVETNDLIMRVKLFTFLLSSLSLEAGAGCRHWTNPSLLRQALTDRQEKLTKRNAISASSWLFH